MHLRIVALAIAQAVLIASATSTAAAAAPAPVVAPIAHMLRDLNVNDESRLSAYYTPDATVVDEFSPYTWVGSNAAMRWWSDLARLNAAQHITGLKAVMQPIRHYGVAGDRAFVIVPLVLTYIANGKRQTETGLAAFTLRRSDGTWRIATQSWAAATDTM